MALDGNERQRARGDRPCALFFCGEVLPENTDAVRGRLVVAEAADATAQLTLINARRSANCPAAYSGATDAASVLKELYNQRAFEFCLEGKRLGDFRRSAASVSNITPAGGIYFKPGYANVGTRTCYPLPRAETDNNVNFKK